jgi:soluble lytic murein transglycosylase
MLAAHFALTPTPEPTALTDDQSLPLVLSAGDRQTYQDIFKAQKKADWNQADALVSKLNDKMLLGHVLAERYLTHGFTATSAQLTAWLNQYPDHPQAYDIYSLAVTKNPALSHELAAVHRPTLLQGYGDDSGMARTGDSDFAVSWQRALHEWRTDNKIQAARIFTSLTNKDKGLSSWQKSAAAYWSYRALSATDQKTEAAKYLRMAAHEPRSFYGIIACKQLKDELDLDTTPITLSDSEILEIIGEPGVRRTIALAQIGLGDLAEKEIRTLFPQAEDKRELQLLALAHQLHLASAELSMSRQIGHEDGRSFDFARYPVPGWEPKGGFTVDPALIYALTRQESGFHASAVSHGGALGLMQLMPKTASLIQKNMHSHAASSSFSEPVMNITLGQNYVQQLLDNGLVNDNLIYMLVAYNAGAGRLQEWRGGLDYKNDPLLFLESIPYAETRHYVTQVMANYWIYSELAGTPSRSVTALISGKWPSYDRSIPVAQLAANNRAG